MCGELIATKALRTAGDRVLPRMVLEGRQDRQSGKNGRRGTRKKRATGGGTQRLIGVFTGCQLIRLGRHESVELLLEIVHRERRHENVRSTFLDLFRFALLLGFVCQRDDGHVVVGLADFAHDIPPAFGFEVPVNQN